MDCAGACGGSAEDECGGRRNGPAANDCDGNCLVAVDRGSGGGSAVEDDVFAAELVPANLIVMVTVYLVDCAGACGGSAFEDCNVHVDSYYLFWIGDTCRCNNFSADVSIGYGCLLCEAHGYDTGDCDAGLDCFMNIS